jgi:hypothetical protein
MANRVNKITSTTIEDMKKKSVLYLPNRPSEKGITAEQVKKYFTDLIVGSSISSIAEIQRLCDEINVIIGELEVGDTTNANNLATSVATLQNAISTLQVTLTNSISTHNSLGTAHSVEMAKKEDKTNKVVGWSATPLDTNYPSEKLVKDNLDLKVDKVQNHSLVSDSEIIQIDTNKTNITTLQSGKLDNAHNTSETAHNDIRTLINTNANAITDINNNKITTLIKSVQVLANGVFRFTKYDDTYFDIDTKLEKVVTNFAYNSTTKNLELTLDDGTVTSIPMTAFIDDYAGVDGTQFTVSIDVNNNISVTMKDGTVTYNQLAQALKDTIDNKVDKATGKSLIADTEITRLALVDNYNDETVNSHIANADIHITALEKGQIQTNKTDIASLQTDKAPLVHEHDYEPINANIQAHISSAHAPSNAQKNSDITKAEIEAKLIGEINTHSHAFIPHNHDTDYYKKSETYTKTEVDSKVSAVYRFKGTRETYAQLLETVTTPEYGDTYNIQDTGDNYSWSDFGGVGQWDKLGSTVDLSNYVQKDGTKVLSTNDLTNTLKTNYDNAYTHSQTAHAPSGAQANVIETVKVNGVALTPASKAVDITIPTEYDDTTLAGRVTDLETSMGDINSALNSILGV